MKKKTTHSTKTKATFVHQAVSFSSHQIVASSVTKGQLKQAQITLPEGAIVNGEVQDTQVVITQLQQLLKQLPLSSTGVVLGIPEHHTFVKQILVDTDFILEKLHQQIMGEVEQFFDTTNDQVHADWTLLNSDHADGQLIQLAAIPHRIAEQFIYILREVKLKTVAIEPPSLTLSRVAANYDHPCLIAEAETVTNLALSSFPNSVDFTSVFELDPGNPSYTEDFSQHIAQMVKYYQFKFGKEVQKIYITGSLAQQCQSALQLQVPIELLNPQTSSVGYNLAEKPVTPPDDPQTINLIPVNLQEDYHAASNERFVARILNISMLFLIALNVVAASFLFIVISKQMALNSQPEMTGSGVSISAAGKLGQVQNQLTTVNTVGPLRDDYPQLYEIIKTNLNDQITLTNISITTNDHVLTLSGISQSQEAILQFKQQLEQQPAFTQIRLPLSIFAQQQEIPFTMSINWTADPQTI